MKLPHIVNPNIERDYFMVHDAVTNMIRNELKEGDDVVWLKGKYKGRTAQVMTVTWDADWRHPRRIDVHIRVQTYRIGSHKGLRGDEPFIDNNDLHHRRYYPLDYFKRKDE